MFSFDRFNLSRFSLGSQDNTIHIELLLAENLESVAGVAIPIETTTFFNDILRGTARGAIGIASAFESYAAMNSAASRAPFSVNHVPHCVGGAMPKARHVNSLRFMRRGAPLTCSTGTMTPPNNWRIMPLPA